MKPRLDQLLVSRGLADTRSKAQALIMAGTVYSGERKLDKPGQSVAHDIPLMVRTAGHPWVSRGGMKLAHALAHFALSPKGKTCLDVGASTGGFTDVLLTHGARHVYAVDVGHGQLDWSLRNDPRVTVLEKTNARHLTREHIPGPVDWVVCDASFISLTKVLPAALALTSSPARCVALIKPQFEGGKAQVGKGGVVRDPLVHREVCERIAGWFGEQPGWQVEGITESPVTGPKGNKEFLITALKT